MKLMLLSIALAVTAAPAHAISRYNSLDLSCAAVQDTIDREGAVIFRYPGERNPSLTLYDRYVAHPHLCAAGEYAADEWIPTRDTSQCYVRTCKYISDDDDFPFSGRL